MKYRGGAVLVSSPAKYGVDAILGTWPHPVGISFGLVKPRPVVVEGAIVARPTFFLTLNFDRRVMAGAQAARFFKRIVDILEHPVREMDDFQIVGGYFDASWQADQDQSKPTAPSSSRGGSDEPVLEAPPTLMDFPTLPDLEVSKILEAPETRDEIPRLEP